MQYLYCVDQKQLDHCIRFIAGTRESLDFIQYILFLKRRNQIVKLTQL